MTKVQIRFPLSRPFDDALLPRIADAHSLYGILRVKLDGAAKGVEVDYDASRLNPSEVQAALLRAGVPITQKFERPERSK